MNWLPGPGVARWLLGLMCALVGTAALAGWFTVQVSALVLALVLASGFLFLRRWSLVSFRVVATGPLLTMILFASLNLSEIAVSLDVRTFALVLGTVMVFGFVFFGADVPSKGQLRAPHTALNRPGWMLCVVLFFLLTLLNIVLAGYVPLLRLLSTGDSGYLEFGVGGIYGFYLAYANALAVTSFYLWCNRGSAVYLWLTGIIVGVFVLFVTRQNIASVIVECFFVYNLFRRRVPILWALILAVVFLAAFSAFGELRSGDIRDIARIKDEYRDLPQAVFWFYSYFYFNVLNLNNLVLDPSVPIMDGSSLFTLLPSFIRPEALVSGTEFLAVSNFTVSSFIYPLYLDMGWLWVIGFSLLVAVATRGALLRLRRRSGLFEAGTVSVLYFCFLFSFFVNFWLYLPIISQVIFFLGFARFVVVEVPGPNLGAQRDAGLQDCAR